MDKALECVKRENFEDALNIVLLRLYIAISKRDRAALNKRQLELTYYELTETLKMIYVCLYHTKGENSLASVEVA